MLGYIKKYAPAFLLGTALTIFPDCKKTDDEDLFNPDLLYQYANLENDVVNSGAPLILLSSITNEEAVCTNCITQDAFPSDRSIRVRYRPDEASPWVDAQLSDDDGNIVFELVKPVPEIKAGKKHEKTDGFVFLSPGIYQYYLKADRSDMVLERDEENNEANSPEGDIRGASAPGKFRLEVRVVDPTGKIPPVYGGKPAVVQYLEYE